MLLAKANNKVNNKLITYIKPVFTRVSWVLLSMLSKIYVNF
nr:MAG TPA: hypothetical protein [Caudoviricetes sp.]